MNVEWLANRVIGVVLLVCCVSRTFVACLQSSTRTKTGQAVRHPQPHSDYAAALSAHRTAD